MNTYVNLTSIDARFDFGEPGEGGTETIGQEKMIKALKKIGKKKNIKAVVLRINSPRIAYYVEILFGIGLLHFDNILIHSWLCFTQGLFSCPHLEFGLKLGDNTCWPLLCISTNKRTWHIT